LTEKIGAKQKLTSFPYDYDFFLIHITRKKNIKIKSVCLKNNIFVNMKIKTD